MGFFDYTSLEDPVVHGLTFIERIVPIVVLIIILFLITKYKDVLKQKHTRTTEIVIASLMMFGEFAFLLWNFIHSLNGEVYFISTLPFHLCSYAIWGIAFALFLNKEVLYKYVFVFAILGSLALFFPNLNHGFDSFRYYQLFYSHSMLLIAWYYLYKVKDWYPTKEDLKKSFIVLQIIVVYSIIANILLKTDFLFIGPGNKPIDFAWDWPWHMIEYEAVMFLFYYSTFLILRKYRYNK